MDKILPRFHKIFTDRCDRVPLLDLGEDSVRYDFFIALSDVKKLKPHDIHLEFAIDKKSYVPRKNQRSYRKEKPQMDLVVDNESLKICAEFGLFRQNSNEKGTINKTALTVKMLNDMIRLGIDSHHTKRRAFFICVADDKMLRHQLRTKILEPFPSNYHITAGLIHELRKNKTSAFDDRFIKTFKTLNSNITAKLIYEADINAKKTNRATKILAWEVFLSK